MWIGFAVERSSFGPLAIFGRKSDWLGTVDELRIVLGQESVGCYIPLSYESGRTDKTNSPDIRVFVSMLYVCGYGRTASVP